MEYSSPELVVVGRAEVLVLGGDPGVNDHWVRCSLSRSWASRLVSTTSTVPF
jgi:hypothetical protein